MMYPYDSPEDIFEAIKKGESIQAIAFNSGLDAYDLEDVKDAIETGKDPLAYVTPYFVAEAKLKKECEKYNLNTSILADWVEYIKKIALDSQEMARQIIKQNKSLEECLGRLLKYSFENAFDIPPEIAKKAVPNMRGNVRLGIPNMLEAKRIITNYYAE